MFADLCRMLFLSTFCLAVATSEVHADTCGDRLSNVQSQIKGLTLKQRTHVTDNFDAFYLESAAPPARITVSCGNKILSFDAEWHGGDLAAYSALLADIGTSLDLGSDDFSSSLQKCWDRASIEDGEDEEGTVVVQTKRAQISCANTNGTAEISVIPLPH